MIPNAFLAAVMDPRFSRETRNGLPPKHLDTVMTKIAEDTSLLVSDGVTVIVSGMAAARPLLIEKMDGVPSDMTGEECLEWWRKCKLEES